MHITAWRNNLVEVLSVVSRALPVKSPIDSIKGILLDAGEDLTFIANNLEFAIKGTTNAEVWEKGKVVLPAKCIDIIRYLPNPQIEIKVDNLNAEIKSGKAVFNLRCIDPEDFPTNTPLTEVNTFQLESEQLKNILARTVFATSSDDDPSKSCFKGLLMEMEKGTLSVIATDTYRLAKVTEEGLENEDFRIIVTGKNILELKKILEDGTVNLYFNKSEMIAVYKQYTFYYRLSQDKYPDLRNVFPEDFDAKITVNAELFEQVLDRAAIVVPDNKTITLKITNNVLNIFAKSDSGEMSENIPVETNGQLDEVLFNVKFIQDVLKNLKGNIGIAFKASPGPCVFFDKNYKYLVLPVAKKK